MIINNKNNKLIIFHKSHYFCYVLLWVLTSGLLVLTHPEFSSYLVSREESHVVRSVPYSSRNLGLKNKNKPASPATTSISYFTTFLCVCLYMCVYVEVYIYICVCIYVRVCIFAYVCICFCVLMCVYVCMSTCVYAYMCN